MTFQLPNGSEAAAYGAVVAALGFVCKLLVEFIQSIVRARRVRRARLVELQSLLRASKAAFEIQNGHAQTLLALIERNHPSAPGSEIGYESEISRAYPSMTKEEKELHDIIRGITINALYPTNLAMMEWLKADTYFKAPPSKAGLHGALANALAQLETHLLLWRAKYESWIPQREQHALVYMADEMEHGLGFPPDVDELIRRALHLPA